MPHQFRKLAVATLEMQHGDEPDQARATIERVLKTDDDKNQEFTACKRLGDILQSELPGENDVKYYRTKLAQQALLPC